jgi:hypothetical protein
MKVAEVAWRGTRASPCQGTPPQAWVAVSYTEVFARVVPGVTVIFRRDIDALTRDQPPWIDHKVTGGDCGSGDMGGRSHRTVT